VTLKCQGRDPVSLGFTISKTAGNRDSVTMVYLPRKWPLYTWPTVELSVQQRSLTNSSQYCSVTAVLINILITQLWKGRGYISDVHFSKVLNY